MPEEREPYDPARPHAEPEGRLTPAEDAFTTWMLAADSDEFNNVGLRRLFRIWMTAWEAALRHAQATPEEPKR